MLHLGMFKLQLTRVHEVFEDVPEGLSKLFATLGWKNIFAEMEIQPYVRKSQEETKGAD